MKHFTYLLFLILIGLLFTGCGKAAKASTQPQQPASCDGAQVGDWDKGAIEHILLTSSCSGHEYTCNQDFIYSIDKGDLLIIPQTPPTAPNCLSFQGERCQFQIIGHLLDINCPSMKRGYKQ